ncbi:hypothetical protein HHX47_DHR4000753 [Lentinula edodes]|nr:hypothetical protein HHX47_DHR4000753 [Lentinula edodes]
MPFVEVTSSTGKTKFKTTISTPNSEDAEKIDASLPTIVFFHPAFLAEHTFQEVTEKLPEIQRQIGMAMLRRLKMQSN